MSTTQEPKTKNRSFLIILIVIVLVGGSYGTVKYIHSLHHEETDDAQVETNIIPVIPRVAGYVTAITVNDNQHVKKGDTLIVLDDRDLQIRVQQAAAALETAKSSAGSARAASGAAYANI